MLMYRSGEEIKEGDHVRFHGNPAEIELVATDPSDPEPAWHVKGARSFEENRSSVPVAFSGEPLARG